MRVVGLITRACARFKVSHSVGEDSARPGLDEFAHFEGCLDVRARTGIGHGSRRSLTAEVANRVESKAHNPANPIGSGLSRRGEGDAVPGRLIAVGEVPSSHLERIVDIPVADYRGVDDGVRVAITASIPIDRECHFRPGCDSRRQAHVEGLETRAWLGSCVLAGPGAMLEELPTELLVEIGGAWLPA